MTYLETIIQIIPLIIHLALAIFCLSKLFKQNFTRYLSKQLWTIIIVFCSLIGPIAYLYLEVLKE
ncbi:PLDc N-terminal domain-containing protein [uncultured Clostridium sp.]|uniref:PLDc N-terminal domain-containing protein n=1 Tax=uncultured Clostridium sp. TaxID=59620 RepID=UPI0028ECC21A|nr:PLDc N-terminal domain-containing protein [uncultured Clostridium sp.]